MIRVRGLLILVTCGCFACCCSSASAADDGLLKLMMQLSAKSADTVRTAIDKLVETGDPRLSAFFDNFNKDNVYIWDGKLVLCPDIKEVKGVKQGLISDPLSGQPIVDANKAPLAVPESKLTEVGPGRQRVYVKDAIGVLNLSNPDPKKRAAAVVKTANDNATAMIPALQKILERETDPSVKWTIQESLRRIDLNSPNAAERIAAAKALGQMKSFNATNRLKEMVAERSGDKPVVKAEPGEVAAYASALDSIAGQQRIANIISCIFQGASSGSILILMALGLGIIFGLMGVINMAHGELMMVGAYATYVTQILLAEAMPGTYILVAIPVSFLTAAIAGYLMEVLVIRHLYGRPLETLLATWGISLVLIQLARFKFGDSVSVSNPTWLRGGAEIMQGVVLPYNRLYIIVFCLLCIVMMYYVIERTKLGLLLRATTQNRNMAASLGVKTRRIDGYTFALGAGLAGLAGYAIMLTDGVRPDMGQNYVVDSFLVVVTGGVGKLAGVIWVGLGLGYLNKIFEANGLQPVWAKIMVLVCIVMFIQWKPSGLFPAKGRNADA